MSISFQSGNNGLVEWALGCDWTGGDIANVLDTGANCGLDCVNYSGCSHFTWTEYNGGTCWLKNSGASGPVSLSSTGAMCGYTTGSTSSSGAGTSGLNIHNWCGVDVTVQLSHDGSCNYGPGGSASNCGGDWAIAPNSITNFPWIADSEGTSVKISKSGVSGILQFEYTLSDNLYWDLSDLDGSGPGLVGTPFSGDNVKVSPTGNGSGSGTCVQLKCPAGQLCVDAYQNPDDSDTRACPTNTGVMWLDLCETAADGF
ncbi:hypothetical protein HK100_001285 [Physocladia obscura]|uniref:Apple domain-containing protein n=1 Tax=Physocladia obscura TaxID=109957 RepID=A0AAD5TDK2_9FUNG|nr:hypothetical protein HK100_001285 [Physocladia obscura]